MAQSQTKCAVCGNSNFFAESGFFFCSECNTQTQDIREEVYDDYFGNQRVTTRKLPKKVQPKSTGQDEKITSWEALNYVLKGITEEIIELGAKPSFKNVVLQLWASYLQKLEIAFTSVQIECKPKFGYAFKHSDAAIVYGLTVKELREKSWQTRSRGSSAASSVSDVSNSDQDTSASGTSQSRRSILRKLTIRKKALASAEYSQQSVDTARSLSQTQTLELLESNSEGEDTPKRLKVTKHARSVLNSSCESSTEDEGRSFKRRLFKKEVSSLRNVTLAKLVAIVNVALAINKDQILLSDFLRWVEEGHISLRAANKFLPAHVKLDTQVQRMLEVHHLSYTKCQQLMSALCHELDVFDLPKPDMYQLTDRYCLELQLPEEICEMAKNLLRLTLNNQVAKGKIHESSHPEVQVMSAILIVMKLLFSLDGFTEYKLSLAAAELNRVSQENGDPLELFVLSEWMQFVECRKAVVASCHQPTRCSVLGQNVEHDAEMFLQQYAKTTWNQSHWAPNQRYALDKQWVEAMIRSLRKIALEIQPDLAITFPPSQTPLHTYTQHLLMQHEGRVSSVKNILQQNYTGQSIVYTTNPDRFAAVGLANDMNIIQLEGAAASFNVDNISKRQKDGLIIPRYGINKFNFKVNVLKSLKNVKEKRKIQSVNLDEKQLNFIKEIVSDDSDDEEINTEKVSEEEGESRNIELGIFNNHLDLYRSCSQYWFCHTKLSKNDITLDEFDMFSKKLFPSSFLCLLKECSRMIYNSPKDLYANIIQLETKYQHILNGSHYLLRNNKRKRQ